METFIQYLFVNLLGHTPDGLLWGGAYFLLRHTKKYSWLGIIILAFLLLSYIGLYINGDLGYWGPVVGLIGIVIAESIGSKAKNRR